MPDATTMHAQHTTAAYFISIYPTCRAGRFVVRSHKQYQHGRNATHREKRQAGRTQPVPSAERPAGRAVRLSSGAWNTRALERTHEAA
jgi:hypothetical protein